MKRITDPSFRYVPAKRMGPDYLKKKFDRIRRELREREQAAPVKVLPIRKQGAK